VRQITQEEAERYRKDLLKQVILEFEEDLRQFIKVGNQFAEWKQTYGAQAAKGGMKDESRNCRW